ncbi:mitochondrial genome maintenance MGM101-domain-containing protein [Phycomyces nitens]|nr:mitochondrial genome maintenance MGM101-domain-containing protein [Phycomyces nitens]
MFCLVRSSALKQNNLFVRSMPSFTRSVTTTRTLKVNKATDTQPSTVRIEKYKTDKPRTPYTRTAAASPVIESDVVESSNVTFAVQAGSTDYFPKSVQFDRPLDEFDDSESRNWSTSFHGLSTQPFPPEISNVLMQAVNENDIEVKPDGMIYLPEIKYRRILNIAFGPGGWGLAPRGEHSISPRNVSREYALVCHGRFVSQARGEQDYFDVSGLPTASEGCKSNALMRCCKDLGIASELWDPAFIRKFKKKHCVEVWAEHQVTKRKKKLWRKKDESIDYPFKETSMA